MNKIIRSIFLMVFMLLVTAVNVTGAEAASDLATLKLKVDIAEPQFWDCTFFPKDADPSKPSVIKAEWSFGNTGKDTKTAVIIPNGKLTGELTISSEKGALVNLDVFVKNSKNKTIGYWGMQLINKGQTETVIIKLPTEIKPEFLRSNM